MSTTDKIIPVFIALALILTMKMTMTINFLTMDWKLLNLMSPFLIP